MLELYIASHWALSPDLSLYFSLVNGSKCTTLEYGDFRFVLSHHEWIADVGNLSHHGKMMKKEMKEGILLKDTLVVEHIG